MQYRVHSGRDWGFIALFPGAVLTDSLKICFDYHRVSRTSRVHVNSSNLYFALEIWE
jgi:hypothetical protein